MPVVFGPALSIDAHGTLGRSITFQKRPSGASVIMVPRPSKKILDNPTALQQATRDYMKEAVEKWQLLSEAEKEQWRQYLKG